MSNLVKTFPQVQFIVATHSPFVVSARKDARVYVLRYEERVDPADVNTNNTRTRYVSSTRLDSVNRAGTANQILKDVLGLPTTYPEWVQDSLGELIRAYRGKKFDAKMLEAMREDLDKAGYSDLYPEVLSAVAKS